MSSDVNPVARLAPVSLFRRLAALVYDLFLLAAALFIATALVLPLTGGEAVAPGNPWFTAYLVAVCYGFFAWFWTHGGQTLGMRAWKLRLQCSDGGPVGWWQALVRFALSALWVLPALFVRQVLGLPWQIGLTVGLGFLWLTMASRLPDRYADTVLVKLR